jgi:RNA polymerase sigma factor (sigma-70 family)
MNRPISSNHKVAGPTASGLDVCFCNFPARAPSSQSPTATPPELVAASFQVCGLAALQHTNLSTAGDDFTYFLTVLEVGAPWPCNFGPHAGLELVVGRGRPGAASSTPGLFRRPPDPPPAPAAYDLDMTRLEDEELAVMAQVCDYRPARDELISRCLRLARRLIAHHACCSRLQEADSQDAQQTAVLWILEAIERYRTDEPVDPGGCHFRTFVYRVLASRLVDFFRYRRLRNHFPLAEAACPSRDPDRPSDEEGPALHGPSPDPLASAEEAEEQARLRQELGRLGDAERRLWDLLAAGTPLRRVAASLGISYDAAKRRRRKLLARLRSALTSERPRRPAAAGRSP